MLLGTQINMSWRVMIMRIPAPSISYALMFTAMMGLAAFPAQAGEKEAQAALNKKAAIMDRLHDKAAKALVNYAQDKTFAEYFTAKGDAQKGAKQKIDQLSLQVQSKLAIEEMCLISDSGREISRIVGNKVAPDSELSPDEAKASFFKPSFAKAAKQYYISPAYISVDAEKWVIAYTSPIMDGEKKAAILHYEMALDQYQQVIEKDNAANSIALAISSDGFVMADSRKKIAIEKQGEKAKPSDYFAKLPASLASVIKLGGEGQGTAALDGANYVVAYKSVADWTIAVLEKQ